MTPAPAKRRAFDNRPVVERFDGPVLVLHGRRDELIPSSQAEALAASAPRGELRLYDCGHYCWFPDRLPLLSDMKRFLLAAEILS